MNAFEKIYKVVSSIPKGKVITYKEVAKKANTNPRTVGFALHVNKNPLQIPCHRVVKSNGKLAKGYAFGGISKQRKKLENEGVGFKNGVIEPVYFYKVK
ncbi:MAG: hypothetical protein A2W22_06415 [Candidatus Levybacteria bacterium RBG_16_35_11]|nr:MAG: hypothetical protein A2W22_06415 [Candidatus Levybacteria bacterium RBG_16_35_11]